MNIHNLKKVRVALGLSQKELAANLKISRERFNQYETGKHAPDYGMLIQIAETLDVDVAYLLGVTDIPNRNTFSLADIPLEDILKAKGVNLAYAKIIQDIIDISKAQNTEAGETPDLKHTQN